MYVNALKWPVIGWVVVDLVLLAASFVSPGIVVMMTPEALSPLLLLFGLCTHRHTVPGQTRRARPVTGKILS